MADQETPVDRDKVVTEGELIAVIVISVLIFILLVVQIALLIYCFCRRRCAQRFPCCKSNEKETESDRITTLSDEERLIREEIFHSEESLKPVIENHDDYTPISRPTDVIGDLKEENEKEKKKKRKKMRKKPPSDKDEDGKDGHEKEDEQKDVTGDPAETARSLERMLHPEMDEENNPRIHKGPPDTDPSGRDQELKQGRDKPGLEPGIVPEEVPRIRKGPPDTDPSGRDQELKQGRDKPELEPVIVPEEVPRIRKGPPDTDPSGSDQELKQDKDKPGLEPVIVPEEVLRIRKDPSGRDQDDHGPRGDSDQDKRPDGEYKKSEKEVTSSDSDDDVRYRQHLEALLEEESNSEESPILRNTGEIRGRGTSLRRPISEYPTGTPSAAVRFHIHPIGVVEAWSEGKGDDGTLIVPQKKGVLYLSPEEDQGFSEVSRRKGSNELTNTENESNDDKSDQDKLKSKGKGSDGGENPRQESDNLQGKGYQDERLAGRDNAHLKDKERGKGQRRQKDDPSKDKHGGRGTRSRPEDQSAKALQGDSDGSRTGINEDYEDMKNPDDVRSPKGEQGMKERSKRGKKDGKKSPKGGEQGEHLDDKNKKTKNAGKKRRGGGEGGEPGEEHLEDSGISDEKGSGFENDKSEAIRNPADDINQMSDVSSLGFDGWKYWPDDEGVFRGWDNASFDGPLEELTIKDIEFDENNRLMKSTGGIRFGRYEREGRAATLPEMKRQKRKSRSHSRPKGKEKKHRSKSQGNETFDREISTGDSMTEYSESESAHYGRPPIKEGTSEYNDGLGHNKDTNLKNRSSKNKNKKTKGVKLGRGLPAGAVVEDIEDQEENGKINEYELKGAERDTREGKGEGKKGSLTRDRQSDQADHDEETEATQTSGRHRDGSNADMIKRSGNKRTEAQQTSSGYGGDGLITLRGNGRSTSTVSGRQQTTGRHGEVLLADMTTPIDNSRSTSSDDLASASGSKRSSGKGDNLAKGKPKSGTRTERRNRQQRRKKRETGGRNKPENKNSWDAYLQYDHHSEVSPIALIFLDSDDDYR